MKWKKLTRDTFPDGGRMPLLLNTERVMANPTLLSCAGVPVPVTVDETHFALSRVLLPEPDDLPPTEAHKQTASSLRL